MKFIIVFVALFAFALAAPPASLDVENLRLESDVGPESFNYNFENSDGTKAEAQGQLNNIGTEQEAIRVQGSFSWVDPEGHPHTINYIADENGYQPIGEDVPQP